VTDQFLAEIRIFPFAFAPTGWAQCNGQILPISQNTALFALLGTTYGGDGKSTFALPNLMGAAPLGAGYTSNGPVAPGLSERDLGEIGGSPFVTLIESEMPTHSHTVGAVASLANRTAPAGNTPARASGATPYTAPGGQTATMAFQALSIAGSSLPHNNLQPYLTVNFCIALQGIFPPRQTS
jgi:microcystin-dependent protein